MGVVGVLALSACGGDDDGTDGGDQPTDGTAAPTDTQPPDDGGEATVAIGANVANTGGASFLGSEWAKAIELAVDQVNETGFEVDGTTYTFELDLQDNQSDPEQAISINQRFVRDGYQYILGPGLSTAFTPAWESVADQEILVLTPATSAGAVLEAAEGQPPLLFHNHIQEAGEDGRIIRMTNILGEEYDIASAAILVPQDPPGEIHSEVFTTGFEENGVEVVYSEFFDPEQRDFSSFIAAMQQADPDIVVVGYLDQWVEPFLSQAIEAGFTDPIFVGSPGAGFSSVEGKTDSISTYIWSVTTRAVDNADDPQVEPYRAAYEAKFGEAPGPNGFWGLSYYDPILMLAEAMSQAGTVDDPSAVAEALIGVDSYDGRVLDLTYDENHRAHYTPQLAVMQDGAVEYRDAG
ncbi:MAG: ABC transporter substrate-binding protein [Actinobacteria bacterium]|nr:ABC transporter substrate-binding protein [Actinomycetota bacterium]